MPEIHHCAVPHPEISLTSYFLSTMVKVWRAYARVNSDLQRRLRVAKTEAPCLRTFHAKTSHYARGMISVALFAAVLAGCSSLFSTTHGADEAVESDVWMRKAAPSPDTEAVYLILSGELAGQAGQYSEALEHYLKAAHLTSHPKVAERATQIALFAKDAPKALEAASLWSQTEPGNPAPKRIAGILNLKQGNIETGVAQLRRLLGMQGVDLEDTLLELVKMLDAELTKEQALQVMQQLERALPKMPEIHFAYALLATNKGEYPLALEQIRLALAMHPRWNRAQVLQAQVMSQMGDAEAARDVLRKALQDDPKNDRLRLMLAQLLTKTGDLAGAERELSRVLNQEPGNNDARMGLAMVLLESGREDRAKAELQRLTGDEKWRGQACFYLGVVEARQGRVREALEWFDRVDSGPNEFDARVNAITVLMGLGRWGEARTRLDGLRTRYPQEALRLYLLESDLLVRRQEHQAAFDLLTGALREMPEQPELLYTRALVAEHLNRFDILENDLRAVLAKHPNDVNALNALGFTLANRGERLDEAEVLLRKALQQKPADPAILDSWGWLQYRKGRLPEALDYLQRAYSLVEDAEIAAHLGEVLWESGRRAEARHIWEKAAKQAPDHVELKRIRAKYRGAFAQ